MRKCLLFAVAIAIVLAMQPTGASENPSLLHVYFMNKADMQKLSEMPLDIPYVTDEYAEVVAYEKDISMIAAAGLHYDIIHDDMVAFYQSRSPLTASMGGYPTWEEVNDSLDYLHILYSDILSAKFSIGQSWQGRDIWVVKLSDNVDIDEDESEVFYNALIHAREPASMAWELYFLVWLLENYGIDDDATNIVNERELWFCLVANPDGYEYNRQTDPNGGGMWRKNRRDGGGVDLNRNWGYMWGYDNDGSSPDPDAETYRGPSAFSEPETQALRDFIISRDFKFIVNAHTYGDWWIYPWGYDDIITPHDELFRIIGDSVNTINDYIYGTAWQTLYNTNGDANDWQYGDTISKPQILCATPETGGWQDGFWPPQSNIQALNEEMLPVGIYIANIAGNTGSIVPPMPPVLNPIGDVDTSSFTVSWTHEDENNPAVCFELEEKTGFMLIEDDLESGTDNWVLDGFVYRTSRYHSYNHSLYTNRFNNFNGTADVAEFFSVSEADTVKFWIWYDIETDFDYAYVEVSTDGGVTFNPIEGNITTNDNPNGSNRGNGITGSSQNQWVEGIFPLTDYIGMEIKIRLSYITDQGTLGMGAYFDDFSPTPRYENSMVIASDIAGMSYEIIDREDGSYYYQVRAKDAENQWSVFSNLEVANVDDQVSVGNKFQVPAEFNLAQNYPNPFNATTDISFALSTPGYTKIEIFDITGKLVRTLVDSQLESGAHSVMWDGNNNTAQAVATGVYFYKLTTANRSETKRMMLLK